MGKRKVRKERDEHHNIQAAVAAPTAPARTFHVRPHTKVIADTAGAVQLASHVNYLLLQSYHRQINQNTDGSA